MTKKNTETTKKVVTEEVEFGLQEVKAGSEEEKEWCKKQDKRLAEQEAEGSL